MTEKQAIRGEILAVTNEIIELKMLKPQTQEIKLTIQRLQQRLNKLTLPNNDS